MTQWRAHFHRGTPVLTHSMAEDASQKYSSTRSNVHGPCRFHGVPAALDRPAPHVPHARKLRGAQTAARAQDMANAVLFMQLAHPVRLCVKLHVAVTSRHAAHHAPSDGCGAPPSSMILHPSSAHALRMRPHWGDAHGTPEHRPAPIHARVGLWALTPTRAPTRLLTIFIVKTTPHVGTASVKAASAVKASGHGPRERSPRPPSGGERPLQARRGPPGRRSARQATTASRGLASRGLASGELWARRGHASCLL